MTDLKFPSSSSDDFDDMSHIPDESSAYKDIFPREPGQEPEAPKEQWVYCPEGNKELYNKRAYKLACFIMGCLIQEEVVQTADHNAFDCSDMAIGIRIIASCLEGNLAEGYTNLPFDF